MLLAVLQRRARIPLAGHDVYASVAGGVARRRARRRPRGAARDRQRAPTTARCRRHGRARRARPRRRGPPGAADRRAGSRKRSGSASAARSCRASTPDVAGHRARPGRRPRSDALAAAATHRRLNPVATGETTTAVVAWYPQDFRTNGAPAFGSILEERLAPARSEPLYGALRLVAPGTPLREGIDRILQAKMGALIVVGDGPEVLNICSGGFLLDAEFTPQRLSELAKMDGAIILAVRRHPGRPGQRAPRSRPRHPDHRDRHPPPHRRAGRPPDRGAGDHRLRGDGCRVGALPRATSRRSSRSRACSRAPTRRCRSSAATSRGSTA